MIDRARIWIDPDTKHAVGVFRHRLAGRYAVRGTVLFGSRARKDHRPKSDVDLAVLLGGQPGSRVDVALDLADIAFDTMLETGILIEPIPFWEDEWEHPEQFTNPALIENIRHDGVRL
jgi:predicted nucleotidyltransferase